MNLSLNEIEAMAKRAARGHGHSWGMAEEAGKAARWLCSQGIDGASVLARVMQRPDDTTDTTSCPLRAGVALSDRAGALTHGPVTLCNLAHPMMILPFAGHAARQTGHVVTVDCTDALAVTDGCGLNLTGTFPDDIASVEIRLGGDLNRCETATRADPDPDAWAVLLDLAHLTYAPSTEESRRLGAGAGISDND